MAKATGREIGSARGFLGTITLYADRVQIVRHSIGGEFVELLGVPHALSETVVRLDRISGFEVVHPLLLPPLIVLQYPGSKPLSGPYWHDAVAENVHMMSFMDNRDLDPFTDLLDRALRGIAPSEPARLLPAPPVAGPAGRDDASGRDYTPAVRPG